MLVETKQYQCWHQDKHSSVGTAGSALAAGTGAVQALVVTQQVCSGAGFLSCFPLSPVPMAEPGCTCCSAVRRDLQARR